MDTIIFGSYTVRDILVMGGAIVALFFVISILRKFFGRKESSPHVQTARCNNCGWKGQVSRYAGKCPKCGQPLGPQMAKRT